MGSELWLLLAFQMGQGEDDPREEQEEKEEENGFEESKEDSDDDGGWITPSNIKQVQQELEQCDVPKDVRVGCVTTDFAMQVGGWAGSCKSPATALWKLKGWGSSPVLLRQLWFCLEARQSWHTGRTRLG